MIAILYLKRKIYKKKKVIRKTIGILGIFFFAIKRIKMNVMHSDSSDECRKVSKALKYSLFIPKSVYIVDIMSLEC